MVTPARRRAVAVLGLLALLGGLAVWFGSLGPAPEHGAYPDEDDLATNYAHYHSEQVTMGGRVIATDTVTIVTATETGSPLRVTITDLSRTVAEGEELRVYGIVEPDHTIRAQNAIAVPQTGRWYAWSVSFFAGLWVLGRLLRHWRLDLQTWTLMPRDVSLAPLLISWLRAQLRRESDA